MKLIYLIVILLLIGLVNASTCPNGIYPCDTNLNFVLGTTVSSSSSSCTCTGGSYNVTYNNLIPFVYNYTLIPSPPSASVYNVTYHNLIAYVYNYTLITPLSIYNSTYNLWSYNQTLLNPISYNHTITSNLTIWNNYGKWFYNQTSLDIFSYNQTNTIKANSITCGDTDKLSAYSNVTGTFTCSTDQTGAGGSAIPLYSSFPITTNTTGLTFITLFTIPLTANTNYTITCKILRSSNATTSGIRYNMSLPNNPDWMTMTQTGYTTTTATIQNSVSGTLKSLMPTAIATSIAYPTFSLDTIDIFIDGNASTSGNAIFQFSGELAGLSAVVGKGSYCKSEVVT
jgi:hypothetical protein